MSSSKQHRRNVQYALEKSGEFIIKNYNEAKPFASFFPGISGLWGIPLWAFYVNRGQCVAGFGSTNKDGSIGEFLPANQAYQRTALEGFRTFIKVRNSSPQGFIFYEPFANTWNNTLADITNQMVIKPHDLCIEETNRSLGLRVCVHYFFVPEESLGVLAREVCIENISRTSMDIEVLDGLPKIVPFGMDNFCLKNLSRTIESMMIVSNFTDGGVPFYHLKTEPQDRPEIVVIRKGNFYLPLTKDGKRFTQLPSIVDPAVIFGEATELVYPKKFLSTKSFHLGSQITENRTPCAMSFIKGTISGTSTLNYCALCGHAADSGKVNQYAKHVLVRPDYFDEKSDLNRKIINDLTKHTYALTDHTALNYYVRQNYLDNILRGGFPLPITTQNGKEILYVYSRKHGDLERDYNNFVVLPTYFSQGNGNYRDINQNRRNDIFFNPDVDASNIVLFMNMLQIDGFNPHVLRRSVFQVEDAHQAASIVRDLANPEDLPKLMTFCQKPFDIGELFSWLEENAIGLASVRDVFLDHLLSLCSRQEDIFHGEGFWSDHWHYNNDLLDSFLAIFPDRHGDLLFEDKRFTYYDNDYRVLPRDEKYVIWENFVGQFGAVVWDEEKSLLLKHRREYVNKMRTQSGQGDVYYTNLFEKLLGLVVNKIASLDHQGIGIEMESDKPNWNDSLNGLPGRFGSSTAETCELLRLARFLSSSLEVLGWSDTQTLEIPEEIKTFLDCLCGLLQDHLSSSPLNHFRFWDESAHAKERFRESVRLGITGHTKKISIKDIRTFLDLVAQKLACALERAVDPKTGIFQTYFRSEAKSYELIYDTDDEGKMFKRLNAKGFPCVRITEFSYHALPLFLEGPVHWMRLASPQDKKIPELYRNIRKSSLFDQKLKMFKVSESVVTEPPEIGRIRIFTPGWLENESIWLHMEYKFLVELLRTGLHREFYKDIQTCLVPFLDPRVYGRSILENSSFICSSAFPDEKLHGNGFVARLSGSTAEFIHIWLLMVLGSKPFFINPQGKLCMQFHPTLDSWLFTRKKIKYHNDEIPQNSLLFTCFADTKFTYHNPQRKPTFGSKAAHIGKIALETHNGDFQEWHDCFIPEPYAQMVRDGAVSRVTISLK